VVHEERDELPRGMRQTDSEAKPPLTYASLDLLLKAEQQEKPPEGELKFLTDGLLPI